MLKSTVGESQDECYLKRHSNQSREENQGSQKVPSSSQEPLEKIDGKIKGRRAVSGT